VSAILDLIGSEFPQFPSPETHIEAAYQISTQLSNGRLSYSWFSTFIPSFFRLFNTDQH